MKEGKEYKIGIIGHGHIGSTVRSMLAETEQHLILAEKKQEYLVVEPDPILFTNIYQHLYPRMQAQGKINCKKGHTYIEGVCRCGKKIV